MFLSFALIPGNPSSAQFTGTLEVVPDEGPVGAVVTLRGKGCSSPPGSPVYLLFRGPGDSWDGQGIMSIPVDPQGRFEVRYRIPGYLQGHQSNPGGPVRPGSYGFGAKPEGLCAARFRVTAGEPPRQGKLILTPARGPIGTAVRVEAQQCLDPGKEVSLDLTGGQEGATGTLGQTGRGYTEKADAQGGFDATFVIPSQLAQFPDRRGGGPLQPGRYLVRTWPPYCAAWYEVTAEPPVARLTVEPQRGPVGTPVRVQGRGCASGGGRLVYLFLLGGTQGATGTLGQVRSEVQVPVDPSGNFELAFQIPAQLGPLSQPGEPGGGPVQFGRYLLQTMPPYACTAFFDVVPAQEIAAPPPAVGADSDRSSSGTRASAAAGAAATLLLVSAGFVFWAYRRRQKTASPMKDARDQ